MVTMYKLITEGYQLVIEGSKDIAALECVRTQIREGVHLLAEASPTSHVANIIYGSDDPITRGVITDAIFPCYRGLVRRIDALRR